MTEITEKDKIYLERAVELSRQGMRQGAGGPFGAVVVLDNKIIGEGWNKVPSTNDPTAHAEVTAIRNACQNLQNFSLDGAYIYVNCEPCPMCLASIYWARISRIYCCGNRQDAHEIGFDDSVIYDEIAKKPSMRKIPLISAEIPLAKEVMQEWKKLPNKTNY